MMRFWLPLAGLIAILAVAPTKAQTPPSFAAPKDMKAGFDQSMLGTPPAPVPVSPAQDALTVPKIWTGGIELGMNGSEGNSELFNFRFGTNFKRTVDGNLLTGDFVYAYARQTGIVTANKALFLLRDEIKLGTSEWSGFVADNIEYDELRGYDFREAVHAGVSRSWVNTDIFKFKTRIGAGTSFDLDTVTNTSRWVPEGLLGYDGEVRVAERQKIVSSADYYPDLANFSQFRVRIRAAYEFLIDPTICLTLRLGVQERYDSSPGGNGVKPNDLDYFATLLLKF